MRTSNMLEQLMEALRCLPGVVPSRHSVWPFIYCNETEVVG